MIVTIDGPAGAGKSSIARELARRLGFEFLDTGAMYRAVALASLQSDVDLEAPQAIAEIACNITLEFRDDQLFLDGKDVTKAIRTPRVTENVKIAAGNAQVREILVEQQRKVGQSCANLVTEGRDQGTVVFPGAECKIFLTASAEERARRRYRQLIANGEKITFAEVLDSQNQRDAADTERDVGPMAKATDAIEVLTDEMTLEEVVTHLVWVVETCQ